jgi:hypothetical protein
MSAVLLPYFVHDIVLAHVPEHLRPKSSFGPTSAAGD